MAKTINELKSAAAVVRDATEDRENTALRIGQLFLDAIETLGEVSTNAIKGFAVISSTDDLPTNPTSEQQQKGYLLGTVLYVYVGTGGDTLDGKYKSADIKGPQGDPGEPGADGHDGVDLGEVALINDLTTGGEGAALSAEMGKKLGTLTDRVADDEIALLSPLPAGYTALEYIDNGSAGSGAVIDTNIVPNDANWRFVGSWKRTGSPSASDALIIGAYGSGSTNNYSLTRSGSTNNKIKAAAYTRGMFASEITLADSGTVWHTFDLKQGTLVIDGSTNSIATNTLNALTATLKIGSAEYPLQSGRLLCFHNDELVAAFQPCNNSSNVYGMYEQISGQFYGSSNENSFSGGGQTMLPSEKVVSGGIMSTYLGAEIEKTLFTDTDILPANSKLDANTTISSSSAGIWNKVPPSTSLELASDNVGLRVNKSTVSYSGIQCSLGSKLPVNSKALVTFEARKVDGVIHFICVCAGISQDNLTNAEIVELADEWRRFEVEVTMGSDNEYFSISTLINKGNRTFEIRNISIDTSVSPFTSVETDINALQSVVFDNILKGKKISILGDSISTYEGNNAVEFTVLESDITNSRTLQGYPTYYDIGTTIGGVEVTSSMVGVQTSFTPVSGDEGKTIGKPLNYNSSVSLKKRDMWWQILADKLGGTILQNVSWSGSSVCSHEATTNDLKTSYAWHDAQINKLATRDAEGNAIKPDVVIIYRGVNDLSHSPYAKLTDFGAGAMSIPATDAIDSGYGFKEAYALLIKKIRTTYPDAMIICCTLNVFKRVNYSAFPTNNGTNTLPEFNNAIREVADMMGCPVIELDKDGITFENCYSSGYITDSSTNSTHPNTKGHYIMAKKAIADVRKM